MPGNAGVRDVPFPSPSLLLPRLADRDSRIGAVRRTRRRYRPRSWRKSVAHISTVSLSQQCMGEMKRTYIGYSTTIGPASLVPHMRVPLSKGCTSLHTLSCPSSSFSTNIPDNSDNPQRPRTLSPLRQDIHHTISQDIRHVPRLCRTGLRTGVRTL